MNSEALEKEVLAGVKKKLNEDEYKEIEEYIHNVRERNIAVLGQNEVFTLRDSGGEIRSFESNVHLAMADGTLVKVSGSTVVSAQGYERLAEGTGTIVMNAPHVLVDGVEQQNPYVIRDEQNGRILLIYCRSISFRYSSKGIPQVSDRTTIFDVPSYRLIDLLAKAKTTPQAFRLLPNGIDPKGEKDEKGATWAKYVFDENTALWINTSHDEALQFYSQIINREKKAMEFAQTFAQRNSVKHLLGIQRVPPEINEKGHVTNANPTVWNVRVICWRPTSGNLIKWDATRYKVAQGKIEELAGGQSDVEKTLQVEAPVIDISHGQDFVGEKDIQAELEPEDIAAESLEESEPPPFVPEGETISEDQSAEDKSPKESTVGGRKTSALYKQLWATAGSVPEIYREALKDLNLVEKDEVRDYSVEEVKNILAKCNELSIA